MSNKAIGIFDSGVGGLTVLTEIRKKLPNENIIYLGDTKNFPYGNKTKEEIIEIAIKNVEILIEKDVKVIVIACGTATSQALEAVQEKFDIPIIGIIEPTINYIEKQGYKKLGVIATEGTIRSNAWEKQLKNKIPQIEVINKACPTLASIAEQGKAESEEGKNAIKEYMIPLKKEKIDKIILGCTHYPLFEKTIKQEMGYEVELINAGDTVADYLAEYLEKNNLQNTEKNKTEIIYLTKPETQFENVAKNIMKIDIEIKNI